MAPCSIQKYPEICFCPLKSLQINEKYSINIFDGGNNYYTRKRFFSTIYIGVQKILVQCFNGTMCLLMKVYIFKV